MLARLTISVALLLALSGPLMAQGRPDARRMTCDQVQSLIDQRGAVVLTTGRYTYDRYVSARGFCMMGERATMSTIPTQDNKNCVVYSCAINDRGSDWLFDRF